MDLTEIRLETRERIGELEEDFWSDDEVDRAINEAVRRFSNEERWPWLITEHTGTMTAEDPDYTLPVNIMPGRFVNLQVDHSSLNRPYQLERVTPSEGFKLSNAWHLHNGRPRFYYIYTSGLEGDGAPPMSYTVKVVPTPDFDYEITAQYFFVPPILSGDSDEPAVPVEYQDAIPAWAAGKLFLKEMAISQKSQEQFAIYANVVEQARAEHMAVEQNTDQTVAWGREHPGERKYYTEYDYVMDRIPGTGLG